MWGPKGRLKNHPGNKKLGSLPGSRSLSTLLAGQTVKPVCVLLGSRFKVLGKRVWLAEGSHVPSLWQWQAWEEGEAEGASTGLFGFPGVKQAHTFYWDALFCGKMVTQVEIIVLWGSGSEGSLPASTTESKLMIASVASKPKNTWVCWADICWFNIFYYQIDSFFSSATNSPKCVYLKKLFWNFPGSPVAWLFASTAGGTASISGQWTKILHATWRSQNKSFFPLGQIARSGIIASEDMSIYMFSFFNFTEVPMDSENMPLFMADQLSSDTVAAWLKVALRKPLWVMPGSLGLVGKNILFRALLFPSTFFFFITITLWIKDTARPLAWVI